MRPEASRAKHKFAVKRNSWPKTRGVAMNPVDHVRSYSIPRFEPLTLTCRLFSLTEVVTINILVKLQLYHGTRHKVKKLVLSQLGGLACYVVRRRRRTSGEEFEQERSRRFSFSFRRICIPPQYLAFLVLIFVLPDLARDHPCRTDNEYNDGSQWINSRPPALIRPIQTI